MPPIQREDEMDFDSGEYRRVDTPTMEIRQPQMPPPPPGAPRHADGHGANWFSLIAAGLVSALVAAVVSLGLTGGFGEDRDAGPVSEPAAQEVSGVDGPPVAPPAEQAGSPIATVASTVLPGTVRVDVSGAEGTGNGSGVVYSEDGLIVTNNHVVNGASQIDVQLSDGTVSEAEVVGTDRLSDLALLRIDRTGLRVPEYASAAPEVGATAIAIGSPFGLDATVTAGIVSALDRTLPGGNQGPDLVGLIQTDAAINPGNSGGALVNDQAQIIGINTAIYSSVQGPGGAGQNAGIGFAVPVETVLDVAEDLLERGFVEYPYLGVRAQPVTEGVAEQFGLDVSAGAIIESVEDGTPADDAGLQPGDIITRIDDVEIAGDTTLQGVLRDFAPGDVVTLTYVRDGSTEQVEVTLAERPAE